MDHDVAIWQHGVQHDQLELGLASHLFETSTAAFSAILNVLSLNPTKFDSVLYGTLRNEFRKFYMWNEGFATQSGGLDDALSVSRNLKATVLKLMVQWARAVCRVPRVFQDNDWSAALPKLVELEVLSDKASQVAQATSVEIRSQYAVIDRQPELSSGSDSDLDSDTGSLSSEATFDDVLEDLKTYIENLMDLSSSIEFPAMDVVVVEGSNAALTDDFSSIPEPVRPFIQIIRDRFPSTEVTLVKKLGEANWKRRERLRLQLASAPVIEFGDLNSDEDSSIAETVRDSNRQSDTRSSLDFSVIHQSVTTSSDVSEPSIFDRNSMFRHRRSSAAAESITSFATSMNSGPDYGQRSVPKLPWNHDFEASFQCQICGEILRNIRNRTDWKKHVYDDLQPYMCLYTDCNLGLKTFHSRREWVDHEFQVHRVNLQWCCNPCKEVFSAQEIFRTHIEDMHMNDFATSQIEEFVSASKRFISRDGSAEECPFCLTVLSQTRRLFASHVGRHLQEISLAALPVHLTSSDDETDSESDEDREGKDGESAGLHHTDINTSQDDLSRDDHPKNESELKQLEDTIEYKTIVSDVETKSLSDPARLLSSIGETTGNRDSSTSSGSSSNRPGGASSQAGGGGGNNEAKASEETEDTTFRARGKLFKWSKKPYMWIDQGAGDVKLLKQRANGRVRLLMRKDKSLKVCVNHYVYPNITLKPTKDSDRSWLWSTSGDVSEGEPEAQTFALRFIDSNVANLFKEAFIKAQQENETLFDHYPPQPPL